MQNLLGKTYIASSATEDVLAMQESVNYVQLDETDIKEMSFSLERAVLSFHQLKLQTIVIYVLYTNVMLLMVCKGCFQRCLMVKLG